MLTVLDDEEQDILTGIAGRDCFYEGHGDLLTDLKEKTETSL